MSKAKRGFVVNQRDEVWHRSGFRACLHLRRVANADLEAWVVRNALARPDASDTNLFPLPFFSIASRKARAASNGRRVANIAHESCTGLDIAVHGGTFNCT